MDIIIGNQIKFVNTEILDNNEGQIFHQGDVSSLLYGAKRKSAVCVLQKSSKT